MKPLYDERQDKAEVVRRIEELPKRQETPENDTWKPDPDTIRVSKCQESPAKRLRQEAEPLKRAKGTGDSPRLSQAAHQTRPDHHKSSPNVASRHKSGNLPSNKLVKIFKLLVR